MSSVTWQYLLQCQCLSPSLDFLCFPLYLTPLSTLLLLFCGLLQHYGICPCFFNHVWAFGCWIFCGRLLWPWPHTFLTWQRPQPTVSGTVEITGPLGTSASLTGGQNSVSRRLVVSFGFWSFRIHKEKACLRSVPWGASATALHSFLILLAASFHDFLSYFSTQLNRSFCRSLCFPLPVWASPSNSPSTVLVFQQAKTVLSLPNRPQGSMRNLQYFQSVSPPPHQCVILFLSLSTFTGISKDRRGYISASIHLHMSLCSSFILFCMFFLKFGTFPADISLCLTFSTSVVEIYQEISQTLSFSHVANMK